MKFLLSLFTLIMFTESCNSPKEAIENSNLKNSNKVENTLSGSYIITQIGENTSISPKLAITFDDELNKVTGFAGCYVSSVIIPHKTMRSPSLILPLQKNTAKRKLLI